MAQEPEWTEEEFTLLLDHIGDPSDQLSGTLLQRSVGAIDCVLAGIDEFPTGRDSGILSGMMRQILQERNQH